MSQEWYDPNNVTVDNFNDTMRGYVKYATKDINEGLKDEGFTDEQIKIINKHLNWGLEWAIDMMTMEEAREYYNK